jgi:hypothetical protein
MVGAWLLKAVAIVTVSASNVGSGASASAVELLEEDAGGKAGCCVQTSQGAVVDFLVVLQGAERGTHEAKAR